MRRRTRLLLGPAWALAAWWAATAPAWADMPDPSKYPEAAAQYERNSRNLTYGTLGCCAAAILVVAVLAIILIRWLIRRRRNAPAPTGTYAAPPAPPPMQAQEPPQAPPEEPADPAGS